MTTAKENDRHIYTFVANRIKHLRKEQNLSQDQFSKYVHLSRVSIANIETGNQKPTLELIWKISSLFAVNIQYFFPNDMDILEAKGKNQALNLIKEIENSL
ncbi:MAG: hypothetical protein CMP48_17820 [Rickettsiales bacterium]|nr:hypothetical protein [Rickettsiales bacterium]